MGCGVPVSDIRSNHLLSLIGYVIFLNGLAWFDFHGISIPEVRATTVEKILEMASEQGLMVDKTTLLRDAKKLAKMVEIINANDGYTPRCLDLTDCDPDV